MTELLLHHLQLGMARHIFVGVLRLRVDSMVQSHGLQELRCCLVVVLLGALGDPLALLCLRLLLMLMLTFCILQ